MLWKMGWGDKDLPVLTIQSLKRSVNYLDMCPTKYLPKCMEWFKNVYQIRKFTELIKQQPNTINVNKLLTEYVEYVQHTQAPANQSNNSLRISAFTELAISGRGNYRQTGMQGKYVCF